MVIHHDVVDGKDFINKIFFYLINIYLEIVVVPEVVDQVLVVEVIRIVVLDLIHVLDQKVHLDQKNDEHDQDLVIVDKINIQKGKQKSLFIILFY
jgi:hypothetical protein